MTVPGVSVVVPAYNSAESLEQLVLRLEAVLITVAEVYELILVNDGSRDNTWKEIQKLAADRGWIRGICLMRNYGQHNALLCGIRAAQYGVVVTMDDDLQHPPEEIPKLLEVLAGGYDVVYGKAAKQAHGLVRNLASRLTKRALKAAMGPRNAENVSAFRAFRTSVRGAFSSYRSPYVSVDVLFTWGTTRFASVEVRHETRAYGRSNYTFGKLASHAIDMMTGFSIWPLRVASLVGFGFTLFGIAVLVYVFGRYIIERGSVPGFPFLASIIAIFSGAQLFALGIIGEYLARIHFRSMDRPSYAVMEDTRQSHGDLSLV